ncbi:MAG: NAD(P)/FAD-dependent oxidoreductase [Myxococcales bacterium]
MPHLAIAGGGPAGLATAIEARRRGLDVTLFERRQGPLDKACGEGLMPAGVRALARLGALDLLDARHCAVFRGIRYVQEDGTAAAGRFRGGTGLGVRRTALWQALHRAAANVGVGIVAGVEVRGARSGCRGVTVELERESFECDLLAAADGLLSPLRTSLGLDLPDCSPRRFGLRRHFAGVAAGDWVEVHWVDGAECYLTPVGTDEIGVAFLWSADRFQRPCFESFLTLFPRVAERLARARPSSEIRGVGSMARRARAVVSGRVALVGDAAGFLDALTGEGLGLTFAAAALLGEQLPAWAAGDPRAPIRYARAHAALMSRYHRSARTLLWLAGRPALRRKVVRCLASRPRCFDAALGRLDNTTPIE